jgi:hypothetical protein
MADPVEPVDLGADPAPAPPSDPVADLLAAQQDTDSILNHLAERINDMENDLASARWSTWRRNRIFTTMAFGALAALFLFALVERLGRRAGP